MTIASLLFIALNERINALLEPELLSDSEGRSWWLLLVLAAFDRDSLPQLANTLDQRQFDEFFRFVISDFCPLNPPKWGTLKLEAWLKVPDS